MDLYIKNTNLKTIGIIDKYISLLWVKRYFTCGEFELYLPATAENIALLRIGYYICRQDDGATMIIESHEIKTDVENGNFLTVSGRSLESILARRIVWKQTSIADTVQSVIYTLIAQNATSPIIAERRITQLYLDTPPLADTVKINKQITGDNLLDAVVELCTAYNIGWRIILTDDNRFKFSLYRGVDRSYNQTENTWVIFSPEFDNLINSSYKRDTAKYANVALVAGEGEGAERKTQTVGGASGLNRYEIFVDERNASTNSGKITNAEYLTMLAEKGAEKLAEHTVTEAFDGEVETRRSYIYRQDWNLGDIVQIENELGVKANSRIIEVVESDDINGYSVVPTFATWETSRIILADSAGYILRDSDGYVLIAKG